MKFSTVLGIFCRVSLFGMCGRKGIKEYSKRKSLPLLAWWS